MHTPPSHSQGDFPDSDRVSRSHRLQTLQRLPIVLGAETQLLCSSGSSGVWSLPVGSPYPTSTPDILAWLETWSGSMSFSHQHLLPAGLLGQGRAS